MKVSFDGFEILFKILSAHCDIPLLPGYRLLPPDDLRHVIESEKKRLAKERIEKEKQNLSFYPPDVKIFIDPKPVIANKTESKDVKKDMRTMGKTEITNNFWKKNAI